MAPSSSSQRPPERAAFFLSGDPMTNCRYCGRVTRRRTCCSCVECLRLQESDEKWKRNHTRAEPQPTLSPWKRKASRAPIWDWS